MTNNQDPAPTPPNYALTQRARRVLERVALAELTADQTEQTLAALAAVEQTLPHTDRDRLPRRPFDTVRDVWALGPDAEWIPTGFNPVYPQPVMSFDGDAVVAHWRSSAFDEGPIGNVHGGVSAFLVDVVAGVMIQALGIKAVTARLDITYRARLPLDADVTITANIVERAGRKLTVLAEITHDGVVAVRAHGLFITIID